MYGNSPSFQTMECNIVEMCKVQGETMNNAG